MLRTPASRTSNDGSDTLYGFGGNDRLLGGLGNDQLFGGSGNDVLIGGAGADKLSGAVGIDSAYDANSKAGVSVSLLAGTGAGGGAAGDVLNSIELVTGSAHNNRLTGNSVSNTLVGLAGNDTLNGIGGNDRLTGALAATGWVGGSGNDMFVFNTKSGNGNVDHITDFYHISNNDQIGLSHTVFVGTGSVPGQIQSKHFHAGSAAQDANDRIIYDSHSGQVVL